MCKLGKLDDAKAMMKTGLGMIILGHTVFILGAIIHGTVLRHVTRPEDIDSIEYAIANIIAVASGLVCVIAGITAIVFSRDIGNNKLKWIVLGLSVISALLAGVCVAGLVLSLVTTIVDGGNSFLARCNSSDSSGLSRSSHTCPFDPTRIYETTVTLWVPLILLAAAEAVVSTRCFLASLSLLGMQLCKRRKVVRARQVRVRFNEAVPTEPAERQDLMSQSVWM
ncbi:keratinocyte-associated protein 3-like [Acipenser ruthenus]|uniref:keratinocyte-associated protein 3-like n=1 Tax=Acipenser ruthenus TaxID=7906 RepID=UPI0027404B8D|nr:keratinocyte-associated protein 3-like [Acipenser ruthenus]